MLPNFDNTEIAFQYRSNAELRRANFLFSSMASPMITKIGMGLTNFALNTGLPIKGLIKSTIFKQFCGGENLQETAGTANRIAKFGVGTILDYSVEGKEDEKEFDHAVQELLIALRYADAQKPNIPFISIKVTGYARFALLEKWHAGSELSSEEAAERQRVFDRIDTICKEAESKKISVLIDAEESWIQAPVDELANTMMERYNTKSAIVFNTFQMYRHDRLIYLQECSEAAKMKGYIFGSKLVRGAYMEKERQRAAEKGYPSPIQADKASTDNDFDAAAQYCLEQLDHITVFIGTHNELSCRRPVEYMEQHGIAPKDSRVWFSQLFGMSDNISFNLANTGYNVAKYMPYGPVKDVVPYLMRRAEENTSVAGQTGRELGLIKKEMKRRRM